jgi:hypothetical protein
VGEQLLYTSAERVDFERVAGEAWRMRATESTMLRVATGEDITSPATRNCVGPPERAQKMSTSAVYGAGGGPAAPPRCGGDTDSAR